MQILKKSNLTFFLVLIITTTKLLSQDFATPLDPEKMRNQKEIGLLFGLGQNFMSGNFRTECDCPEFINGTKFGYTIGALYEMDFTPRFMWGAALIYTNRDIYSEYQIIEDVQLQSIITGKPESAPIKFKQKANADFSYLTLMPYIKWNLAEFMFIKLGFSGSFVLNNKIKHEKELIQKTARLSSGEIVSIKLDSENGISTIIEEGDFPQTNSFQISLDPMLGFNIALEENLFLSPVLQYSLPLSNISERGENFKIGAWRFLLELRLAFNLRMK
jgi:hypothetical protein